MVQFNAPGQYSSNYNNTPLRQKSTQSVNRGDINKWRKRLGMLPENNITNTLDSTTHHYIQVVDDNRENAKTILQEAI